jgi:hypothetical protein
MQNLPVLFLKMLLKPAFGAGRSEIAFQRPVLFEGSQISNI